MSENNIEELNDNLDEKGGNSAVSADKVKVNYLNFNGDRFKSEPQKAEDVKNTKDMEKYLRDTNAMMEEIKEDETKLGKSVRRQEVLVERIVSIGNSSKKNTDKLTKRQTTNDLREEQKINQLNEDLVAKLSELDEKRAELETAVPSNMDAKMTFVQSAEGQALINQLLVDSLAENNEELVALAKNMIERDVINEDPKSGFSDLIEKLAEKHEFLVTAGGDGEEPKTLHISKSLTYTAAMGDEIYLTSFFADPYASSGHGLLINNEAGSTFKLSQRVGPEITDVQFNFFEVAENGLSQISRASGIKFEGNTLQFSYLVDKEEVSWTINGGISLKK